jgi:hypothetical protein
LTPAKSAAKAVRSISVVALRSEGQRLLIAVNDTATTRQIASSCGVTHQVVAEWLGGRKVPRPENRAGLWNAYSIPAPSWGRLPLGSPASTPQLDAGEHANGNGHAPTNGHATPATPAPPSTAAPSSGAAPSSVDDARVLLGQIRARATAADLLPSDAVRLADSEAKILALLHRMQRDADLLEDRIVREHPAWQRTRAALTRVLARHPLAAAEVADELEKLGM